MLLTFDDGLREIKDVVAPILLRRGIPAVFFVTTGFIDNRGMQRSFKASLIVDSLRRDCSGQARRAAERFFARAASSHVDVEQAVLSLKYKDNPLLDQLASQIGIDFDAYLREHRPFMTKDEVMSLRREGFEIGAHSVDHPKFADIPLDQQMAQTVESLDYVQREFKPGVRLFAFPFSDRGVSRAFFDWAFGEGGIDLTFGTGLLQDDVSGRSIQRCPMERGQTDANTRVRNIWVDFYVRKIRRRNKIQRP